ncbi:MAG: glycosyltransferase family 4 protein [Caldilineaceae bacterium]|nr:glycosyltransferase family 4 protein [Caldilineaceae bacterium]
MKVVFLTTSSLDSPYGIGRCLPLARQLVYLGHRVHIVALHHNLTPSVARRQEIDGVQVEYAGQMHVRKVDDTTLYYSPLRLPWVVAAGAWGLARAALALQADVLHIGKPHPQNTLAGLLAARLRPQTRVILDYDDYEAGINRFGNRLERAVLTFLEDFTPRWFDGITTHSTFLAQRLLAQGIPPARILRLPSAFDPARFAPVSSETSATWRQRLGLGERKVVVYVGTVSFVNHAVDLLLYAFAGVAADRDDLALLIVGGGQDVAQTQALAGQLGIAHLCRFTGRVDGDAVPALFQLAALSVDPARHTPTEEARWPLKIVESLAAGVPVLTGDVGDRREMLGDGAAGLLVAPDDAEALAEGMAALLAAPERLAAMSTAARHLAARYDPARLAPGLVDFYQKLD